LLSAAIHQLQINNQSTIFFISGKKNINSPQSSKQEKEKERKTKRKLKVVTINHTT